MKKFTLLLFSLLSVYALRAATYTEDFETLTNSGYATASVTLNGYTWEFDGALSGNGSSDFYNGTKSVRIAGTVRTSYALSTTKIEMTSDKAGGVGTITFQYKQYGTDTQVPWSVEWYDGTQWTSVGTITATSTVQTFSYILNNSSATRIRIVNGSFDATVNSNGKRINIDDISLTDYSADGVVPTPEITPESKYVFDGSQTVSISTYGADTTVYYTTDGTTPSASSLVYSDPFSVSSTATVKAIAITSGGAQSAISSATYSFPVEVANIGAFLSANSATSTTLYKITGTVVVTYQNGSNLYVKDDTGSMLIYGSIDQTLSNGQTLTGMYGTYTLYSGVNEFIPELLPTAVSGTSVSPEVMSIASITNDDQAKYVKLEGVKITLKADASTKVLVSGSDTILYYDRFGVLTGTYDVNSSYDLAGVLTVYNSAPELYPTSVEQSSGIVDLISEVESVTGGEGYVLVSTSKALPVNVYSIIGLKITSFITNIGESKIALPKGLYIINIGTKAQKVLVK
ncbi:MAG: hypothetical protein H6Q14_2152 [Bacteroidetes bacterium]|nr:hypothetical protein [Bacteroidota bacterium]